MQDVPKIIRDRLKAPSPDGRSMLDHPDANVLTAFAERSLPQSEKAAVLVHLSRCVDCRDIVALALPPTEAAQPGFSSATTPAFTPSRSGWLTWPTLRWGFVAAGVAVVASVGLIQYQHGKSQTAARLQTPAPPTIVANETPNNEARNEAVAPASAAPTSVPPAANRTWKSAPKMAAEGKVRALEPARSAPTATDGETLKFSAHLPQRGMSVGGPLQSNVVSNGQFGYQQQNNQVHGAISASQPQLAGSTNAQAPTSAPVPPAGQAVRVEPQSGTDDKQIQAAGAMLAQNQPVAPTPQDEAKGISRSKPPETTTVEVASAAPVVEPSTVSQQEMPKAIGELDNGRNFSALVVNAPPSQPRWTISPKGSLQRSYDQGSTWQDVNVMASLASASSFASYDANALTSLAQSQPIAKKADKRTRKQDLVSPVFRAVTVTGSDVWAGGSNAALYHSTDSGNHWMQILPSSGGTALTGDVVALEFLDPQHGKVTTSTPEVWTTADAGQSWQKQ